MSEPPQEPEESQPPGEPETEPDPRFTFANERTFLAWNRTALALVSAGAAAAAFLKTGLGGARLLVAVPLIALGAGVSLFSYRRWMTIERAMRRREPIPGSSLPKLLGIGIAVLSVVVGILAVVELLDE